MKLFKSQTAKKNDPEYRKGQGGKWYQFYRNGDAKNHLPDPYWTQNKNGDGLSPCTLHVMEDNDLINVNEMIGKLDDKSNVSDGIHSFGELYEHRILNFLLYATVLSNTLPDGQVWSFDKNANGDHWDGWFGVGIFPEEGRQITYHMPIKYKSMINFKHYDKNPHYDGHTTEDITKRMEAILKR